MSYYFQDRDEIGAAEVADLYGNHEGSEENTLIAAESNILMALHELDSLLGDDPVKASGIQHLATALGILEEKTEAEVTMEITETSYDLRWTQEDPAKEAKENLPETLEETPEGLLSGCLSDGWEVDADGDEWATAYRDDDEVQREITVRKDPEEWRVTASGPNLQRWPSGTPWDLVESSEVETLGRAVDEALRMAREAEEEAGDE